MTKFQRDITITLGVKAVLLFLLWYVCFSGPRHHYDVKQLLFESSQTQIKKG